MKGVLAFPLYLHEEGSEKVANVDYLAFFFENDQFEEVIHDDPRAIKINFKASPWISSAPHIQHAYEEGQESMDWLHILFFKPKESK